MHAARSVLLLISGLFAGIALVLACGNNSTNNADAGTACDCPAAEPPLEGRIVYVNETTIIPPGESNGVGVACPEGGILLGGSCLTNDQSAPEITLQQAGQQVDLVDGNPTNFWVCGWHNNDTSAVTVRGEVTCLTPAQ